MPSAPVKIDARYATAAEHHNPIELFTTICEWRGGKLTVWESSQNMWGFKKRRCQAARHEDPDNIHVLSPFVGGTHSEAVAR